MTQRKRILLDNALLSWVNAIRYCDQITAGRITLEVRKNFVSALHNAVELFLKQIMLDDCDYRVAEPRNIQPDGEPAKAYYSSQNLNLFFESIDGITRMKFVSIDFNKFLDLHKELLSRFLHPGQSFKHELRVLKDLRNNETHFYIGRDEYLTEKEFQLLYNFMVDFYQALHEYNLLPFWGEPSDGCKRYRFERSYLDNFSYRDAVRTSKVAQLIAEKANGIETINFAPLSAYEKATVITFEVPELMEMDFDELWAYIETLDQFQMIDVVQVIRFKGAIFHPDWGYISSSSSEQSVFELRIELS